MVRSYQSTADRRQKTVETVVALSAERDPATLTTLHIAESMQLTQGALFRHFPNKDAIFEAVVHWVVGQLMRRVRHAAETAADPVVALQAVFEAHAGFLMAHPGAPRVLVGQLQAAKTTGAGHCAREFLQEYHGFLVTLIDRAVTQGGVRADVPTDAMAAQFMATLQGLVFQALLAGHFTDMAEQAAMAYRIFQRGIAPD